MECAKIVTGSYKMLQDQEIFFKKKISCDWPMLRNKKKGVLGPPPSMDIMPSEQESKLGVAVQ